jgi:hypothetical protein
MLDTDMFTGVTRKTRGMLPLATTAPPHSMRKSAALRPVWMSNVSGTSFEVVVLMKLDPER